MARTLTLVATPDPCSSQRRYWLRRFVAALNRARSVRR